MHLADAFIQSDLQYIQVIHFHEYVCSLGIEPTTFCAANAMLYHWATQEHLQQHNSDVITPHFMDDRFVKLGEEVIQTLLWQSGLLNQWLQVCFVISLSICYWLFKCWVLRVVCVWERGRKRVTAQRCVFPCVREWDTVTQLGLLR